MLSGHKRDVIESAPLCTHALSPSSGKTTIGCAYITNWYVWVYSHIERDRQTLSVEAPRCLDNALHG